MGLLDTAIPSIEPRRLPIYLLIDTSCSMKGNLIESVKLGIKDMLNTLRNNPFDLETAHISIITFGRHVEQLLPLTPIDNVQVPEINTDEYGHTHIGAALEMLLEKVDKEVIKCTLEQRGDYKPILFILTDGQPTDITLFNRMVANVKAKHFQRIICYALGPIAKTEYLRRLTNEVYQTETIDGAHLTRFISYNTGFPGEWGLNPEPNDSIIGPPPEGVDIVI